MATTYQTAKYYYCEGFALSSVTVTMAIPSCPTYGVLYDDEYCQYETKRKTYTWTLSHAVSVPLAVRYSLTWWQERDGVPTGSGTVTFKVTIPVGVTSYSLTMGTSKSFTYNGVTYTNYPPEFCEEERWCTWGSSTVRIEAP